MVSICMEVKRGKKTVLLPDHARIELFKGGGGVRGVQDEDILSMHLESHIGLFFGSPI